ncbi:DUF1549 domain-containing protein [Rhodopirellula sallentina]|uniref:Protein containing DUF1549 n=1 Tax=Rhodopirellula sallentina SM41 TaxID=1263870 RepID=M5U0B3_9BACT|nr:DUF1549 domain-containing protein [Rhodopirellula sallentina]EMI54895.1 protein containing DUF1549 [Rhodopirellula sallentina SM41]
MNEPFVSPAPPHRDKPPRTFRSKIGKLARFGFAGFCVLSTFAFLTSGMSTPDASTPDASNPDAKPQRSGNGADDTSDFPNAASVSFSRGPHAEERLAVQQTIHELWESRIAEDQLETAPPADWLTVCRRLSLALVGTGLSLEEIRKLESHPEQERVERHRESLLSDPRFHDYWAERFTRFYVGADEGPFLVYRRRRFRTWLSDQFAAQIRYDDLVRRLITAKGLWTDRPEVNFYTVTFDSGNGQPDPIRMAARTCRAFLGIRIDCLQCHDDFLGNVSMGDPLWMGGDDDFREGTQQDFHALAAFFTAAKNEGLQGLKNRTPNYHYQYLDADEEVEVQPNVPYRRDLLDASETSTDLNPTPETDSPARDEDTEETLVSLNASEQTTPAEPNQTDERNATEERHPTDGPPPPDQWNQRRRLARWITHPENVQFARAFVVRAWTLMFGSPPGNAVDDLPLNEDPNPIVMTLSKAFIDSGYDIRNLIRMMSDMPAFRVDSQSGEGDGAFEVTERHERAMAVFPIVRLRAEQVAGAAIQSSRVKTLDRETSFLLRFQQYQEEQDFLKRYGDMGEDEFTRDTATITQRLVMLNGKLTSDVSKWNPILNTTSHVGMFAADHAKVVESLYLATLNRYPTPRESEHFVGRIEEGNGRKNAIVDIVWVLLNSSEFAWNH